MDDWKVEQGTMEEERVENPVDIPCPDCRGPLREYRLGSIIEYRCRVGHAHSPLSMMQPQQEAQKRAFWAALVALEEGATLSNQLADSTGAEAYAREAQEKARHAEALRMLITNAGHLFRILGLRTPHLGVCASESTTVSYEQPQEKPLIACCQ